MNTIKSPLLVGAVFLLTGILIGYYGFSHMPATPESAASMHGAMDGMTIGLSGKSGDTLDEAFLDEMIVHHEGAVEMAHTLLAGTKRPELLKLGSDIIAAQTEEIQQMKSWRAMWFNR